jgi:hypothetical protein
MISLFAIGFLWTAAVNGRSFFDDQSPECTAESMPHFDRVQEACGSPDRFIDLVNGQVGFYDTVTKPFLEQYCSSACNDAINEFETAVFHSCEDDMAELASAYEIFSQIGCIQLAGSQEYCLTHQLENLKAKTNSSMNEDFYEAAFSDPLFICSRCFSLQATTMAGLRTNILQDNPIFTDLADVFSNCPPGSLEKD